MGQANRQALLTARGGVGDHHQKWGKKITGVSTAEQKLQKINIPILIISNEHRSNTVGLLRRSRINYRSVEVQRSYITCMVQEVHSSSLLSKTSDKGVLGI